MQSKMIFKFCEGILCSSFYVKEFDAIVHENNFPCITLLNFWPFCTPNHYWTWWLRWELGIVTRAQIQYKKYHLTSIGNPIVEIRQSYDHLISAMRFPILVRQHLYIESGPRSYYTHGLCFVGFCCGPVTPYTSVNRGAFRKRLRSS